MIYIDSSDTLHLCGGSLHYMSHLRMMKSICLWPAPIWHLLNWNSAQRTVRRQSDTQLTHYNTTRDITNSSPQPRFTGEFKSLGWSNLGRISQIEWDYNINSSPRLENILKQTLGVSVISQLCCIEWAMFSNARSRSTGSVLSVTTATLHEENVMESRGELRLNRHFLAGVYF